MLISDEKQLAGKLACPRCKLALRHVEHETKWACNVADCDLSGQLFEKVHDKSILVDFDQSLLVRETTLQSGAASVVHRRANWRTTLNAILYGGNAIAPAFADEMVSRIKQSLGDNAAKPLILVVGGGTIGSGSEGLYQSEDVEVMSVDIYASPQITCIADGHCIPLTDQAVDAVWIQAVLEHVIEPYKVVQEIRRVLKPGGLVFADTPFMWPVHEKAYDFTRWTAGGHRWLFRDFDVLAAGASSGPGTLFVLSVRYLAAALFRSWTVGDLCALPFFWVRLLDRYCEPHRGLDASAGLYFFGRKAERPASFNGIVDFYEEQPMFEQRGRAIVNASATRQAR